MLIITVYIRAVHPVMSIFAIQASIGTTIASPSLVQIRLIFALCGAYIAAILGGRKVSRKFFGADITIVDAALGACGGINR